MTNAKKQFHQKTTISFVLLLFALVTNFSLNGCGGGGGGGGGGGATMGAPPATMPSRPTTQGDRTGECRHHAPFRSPGERVERLGRTCRYPPGRACGSVCCSTRRRTQAQRPSSCSRAATERRLRFRQGSGIRFSGNFLVRSSALFADAGFITAIVDSPSDRPEGPLGGRDGGMTDDFRQSSMHLTDIRAVVDFLVDEGAREIYLIGTSRGTLSVAYLATVIDEHER